MDLIFNKNMGEVYTVHYLKMAIYKGENSEGLQCGKEYYILSEKNEYYTVRNDNKDEVLVLKEKFEVVA